MSGFDDYENYDGIGLAALIKTGEVSPVEALEAAIERIERRNPTLNAVIHTAFESARRGVALELPWPHSPLAGVPFLLKDLGAAWADQPLTAGSRLLRGFTAEQNSTLVERYKHAGLLLVGQTNTPEFGIAMTTEPVAHGPTRNPWNTDRSAGGSSGGAAAAVAAGMVPLAHANDGGGSIRMPAANCGLFGLKPTRGRTPAGPLVGEGSGGLSVNHCISRSVRDSAALLDLSHGPAPGDPYCAPPVSRPFGDEVGADPGRLEIALLSDAPSASSVAVHPDCVAAVSHAGRLCESLGHRLVPVRYQDLGFDFEQLRDAVEVVIAGNLRYSLEQHWAAVGRQPGPDDLETITWLWSERGRVLSAAEYAGAVQFVHALGRRLAAFFQCYDVLLSPVLAQPPLPLGATSMMSDDLNAYRRTLDLMPFTSMYNLAGCPAMSVPLYWNAENLPVGVQFGAPFGDEATLLRLAGQLEQAQGWFNRRPPPN